MSGRILAVAVRARRWGLVATAGLVGQFPVGCDLGEFTATSTVTLDGRQVVQSLVRGALVDPIEAWIDARIDDFFDQLEDEPG